MYNNAGRKIKIVAMFLFIVSSVFIVIGGFILLLHSTGVLKELMPIWIAWAVFISWVGSILMYGFGEIVERVVSVDEKMSILIEQSIKNNQIEEMYAKGIINEQQYNAMRSGK